MRAPTWPLFAFMLLAAAPDAGSQPVQVDLRADGFSLHNRFLERKVQTQPRLHTVSIVNKETGREWRTESEEFLIVLDDGKRQLAARDFKMNGNPVCKDLSDGGKQVRCDMTNAEHGVRLSVVYEINSPASFWTRKWIALDAGERLVNSVCVERLRFASEGGPAPELKRFDLDKMPFPSPPWDTAVGRPVYAGKEIFLGLEHPAGRNEFDENGAISLRHHPGRRGSMLSRPAVIGVAPDRPCERVNDRFLEYIDRIRARPVKRHAQWIAYFNVGVTDETAVEKMQFARKTFADRGARLDCVLMDSGWTDGKSIMRISPQRPDRPGQIRGFAQKYLRAGLGLHVITSGRKTMVDKDWLAAQGYDLIWHANARDGAYCMADPRVQEEFASNLARYIKDYDLAAYKFDWGAFNCAQAGHRGHLPGIEYGLEANCDGFIKALQAFRAAKRSVSREDIFLFNTGWYSPWWLMHYDAVFSAGADYNFSLVSPPAFATCTALGTWRDAVVRGNLVQWIPFFPLSSLMHHSPTSHWWHDWHARYKDPLDQFAGHMLMGYLRGSQMTEIGINIASLTDEHRDVLASIMNWAARHDDVLLASTRFLGGDPLQGEAYGYAHFAKDGRGIIGVKNPHVLPQQLEFKLGEECGLRPTNDRYSLRIVYPYRSGLGRGLAWGASVKVALEGHEVLVIEAAPGEAAAIPPRDARGKSPDIQKAQAAPVEGAIQGGFEINVPQDVSAALVLLGERRRLTATVWLNGKEAALEAPHVEVEDGKEPARTYDGKVYSQRGDMGLSIKGPWSLFRAPLPAGRSEVRFSVRCPDLDLIHADARMKPGALPSPRSVTVPFRCVVQTQQDLAPPPNTRNLSDLPDRWANVLRRTVYALPPADVTLQTTRRFEFYETRPGAKLFADSDATITALSPELVGGVGIRIPKSQAAQSATLSLSLPRPSRIVAAFAKDKAAPGYLPPPPDWSRCPQGVFETTDPLLGRELYVLRLPKGEWELFPSMSGVCAVLAVVPLPENLAAKRPVSVLSTHDSGHSAVFATDGDIRTQWWSANGLPQWAQVDLGAEKNVNSVRIIFYHNDDRSYQHKVETSRDGRDWQPAADATKNRASSTAAGMVHCFETRPARFVRVTVTGGRGRVSAAHICELEAYDDRLAPLEIRR